MKHNIKLAELSFKDPPAMRKYISRKIQSRASRARKLGNRRVRGLRVAETAHEAIARESLATLGYEATAQKLFPFRESHPDFRIVDFWIPNLYIAIEIDGNYHKSKDGRKDDARRRGQFRHEYPHVKFLRFTNDEVESPLFKDRLKDEINAIELTA